MTDLLCTPHHTALLTQDHHDHGHDHAHKEQHHDHGHAHEHSHAHKATPDVVTAEWIMAKLKADASLAPVFHVEANVSARSVVCVACGVLMGTTFV